MLAPSVAVAREAGWTIERWRWAGAAGARIAIESAHGDVRVRGAATDEVEVTAVLQHAEGDPLRLEVRVDDSGPTLRIGVAAGAAGGGETVETAEMRRRRADLVVMVPSGVPLLVRTVDGRLEVKGLVAAVDAASRGGAIVLQVGGEVHARSEWGAVEVVLEAGAGPRPATIETLTGDVLVWLPREADVTATVESRGEITTDYSLAIERDPLDDRLKRATARIGAGGIPLHVQSNRGNVRLLRSP